MHRRTKGARRASITMVLFLLYMKAEMEGVASVALRGDNLIINVTNPLSDFEVRENVVVNASEYVEQEEGSREPPHHFALKWEGSKKASTLTVLSKEEAKTALKKKSKKKNDALIPGDYDEGHSGDFSPVLAVECRGLEPSGFVNGEIVVTSSGGTVFTEDIELSEGDWADYDAENDAPVSLSEVEFKWEAV